MAARRRERSGCSSFCSDSLLILSRALFCFIFAQPPPFSTRLCPSLFRSDFPRLLPCLIFLPASLCRDGHERQTGSDSGRHISRGVSGPRLGLPSSDMSVAGICPCGNPASPHTCTARPLIMSSQCGCGQGAGVTGANAHAFAALPRMHFSAFRPSSDVPSGAASNSNAVVVLAPPGDRHYNGASLL